MEESYRNLLRYIVVKKNMLYIQDKSHRPNVFLFIDPYDYLTQSSVLDSCTVRMYLGAVIHLSGQ